MYNYANGELVKENPVPSSEKRRARDYRKHDLKVGSE
jgi:hypothetical protein